MFKQSNLNQKLIFSNNLKQFHYPSTKLTFDSDISSLQNHILFADNTESSQNNSQNNDNDSSENNNDNDNDNDDDNDDLEDSNKENLQNEDVVIEKNKIISLAEEENNSSGKYSYFVLTNRRISKYFHQRHSGSNGIDK